MKKRYFIALSLSIIYTHFLFPAAQQDNSSPGVHFHTETKNPVSSFSDEKTEENEIFYDQKKLTRLKRMRITGITFTAVSAVFITTGFIFGVIPAYAWGPAINQRLPQYQDTLYTDSFTYMVIMGSIGVSLIISGSVLFLIGMPLLIYSLVKLKRQKFKGEGRGRDRKTKPAGITISGGSLIIRLYPGKNQGPFSY